MDELFKKLREHFGNIDLEQFKKDCLEINAEIEGTPNVYIEDFSCLHIDKKEIRLIKSEFVVPLDDDLLNKNFNTFSPVNNRANLLI